MKKNAENKQFENASYLIDRLTLRVGNEKSKDEALIPLVVVY